MKAKGQKKELDMWCEEEKKCKEVGSEMESAGKRKSREPCRESRDKGDERKMQQGESESDECKLTNPSTLGLEKWNERWQSMRKSMQEVMQEEQAEPQFEAAWEVEIEKRNSKLIEAKAASQVR